MHFSVYKGFGNLIRNTTLIASMDLTQSFIDKVFSQLRIIHKSHWKAPKLEEVQREIGRVGKFVFRIGAAPYVAEVAITPFGVSYEVNPNLPERMKKQAETMREKFERAT